MIASTVLRRFRGGTRALLHLAGHGRPARALLFGPLSLGDDLLCTTVLREARSRGAPFAMMTTHPELFAGNSDPSAVLPVDDYYIAALRRLGTRVVQPYYNTAVPGDRARDGLPPHHIVAEMCRLAGLSGEIALRPYLHLTPDERAAGRRLPRQIAIQSTCLNAAIPYPTKEWGDARFSEVARQLRPDFSLVQLGGARDPALPVDLDLRGRTTLREAAAVLSESLVFIGLEGFLAHLARAIDCPAVIVHGGRAPEGIFSYSANRNLYSRPPCSPCGLRTDCPNNLECLAAISPTVVAVAAREIVARPPTRPLAAETFLLS